MDTLVPGDSVDIGGHWDTAVVGDMVLVKCTDRTPCTSWAGSRKSIRGDRGWCRGMSRDSIMARENVVEVSAGPNKLRSKSSRTRSCVLGALSISAAQ